MNMDVHESLKEILARYVGKEIRVRLEAGTELTGTLSTVGDQVIHLSELSGEEFYDAVVRIDSITALIVRARGN